MSVLTNLISERERWAKAHKTNEARRNRLMFLQYVVLLVMGFLAVVYYQKIVAVVYGMLPL